MTITKDDIKYKNGKAVKETVTDSNAYGSTTATYERQGNKTVVTDIKQTKK